MNATDTDPTAEHRTVTATVMCAASTGFSVTQTGAVLESIL